MLANLRKRLSRLARRLFARRLPNDSRFEVVVVQNREYARQQLTNERTLVVVGSEEHPKWLLLRCPCRCGETLELNLMRTHSPRWRVEVERNGAPTLSPSVDAQNCGAHFWIRQGRLTWVD